MVEGDNLEGAMSAGRMFSKVLVANRGEIAVRMIRTLQSLHIGALAVYAEADRNSLHVSLADEAVPLGAGNVAQTYLQGDRIIAIARQYGAQAILPGYGFLSENADFAEACERAGIVFVGPTPAQIRQFGLKHTARSLCQQAGVPLAPGTGLLASVDDALATAEKLGYPLMLKSTAGGGGIGLTRCESDTHLANVFDTTVRLGENYFRDGGVFLERFIEQARHIEVQIFGDGCGQVVALGERDCSLQRRNQKVLEETPAPGLSAATRSALLAAAVALGKLVNYRSAGTVEFIYDPQQDQFYFLEVNSRLQVEHTVTEMVTGLDLVAWMLQVAAGCPPAELVGTKPLPVPQGAAIEVRIYAEEPLKNFQPAAGVLTRVEWPAGPGVRVDSWVERGSEISSFYDPLLAKLVVQAADRPRAIRALQQALDQTALGGISHNLDYLRQVVRWPRFIDGAITTRALASLPVCGRAIEVLAAGTFTTVQDYPGRKGYWDIGVPPSGPMDDFAFRLANRIVGNHPQSAGLECTLIGPVLKFHGDALIALTGGLSHAVLTGAEGREETVPFWRPVAVQAGQTLQVGKVVSGCRTYLAVRGGLDVPEYMGSRSTFVLGQFGGHAGRTLGSGDMLPISDPALPVCRTPAPCYTPGGAPASLIPTYPARAGEIAHWQIGVMQGPHGAPDFFTPAAMDMFFQTDWTVHYNSNRLGIRLNGPKASFTRTDGGEAGLHPSNIHDCEYAIGAINFTGDMPVILTHDGPSLGGFVCPVTIVQGELWKVGQVKPGDTIRFVPMGFDQARAIKAAQDQAIISLQPITLPSFAPPALAPGATRSACVLAERAATATTPEVVYRQAGDNYLLVEYGPMVLDLRCRLRVHALMAALAYQAVAGIEELAPGVRSLQVRYDSQILSQSGLLAVLQAAETQMGELAGMRVPSRIVYLPMAFEDSSTREAVARYRQSVRDTAPWLPDNIDFIQRINGLPDRQAVKRILFDASYMVLGLGDVYLGAPCAVPIDPRHRLMTSKYNPARTYTAEGAVGIGGVYMCIYGMDSPGGYQLVGRTLPIWNKFLKNRQFEADKPWLLRFFDQVRYYEVSEAELLAQREAFREGRLQIRIEETVFSLDEHDLFLRQHAADIRAFQRAQQAAFKAEVARWQDLDSTVIPPEPPADLHDSSRLTVRGTPVCSDIAGNIWQVMVRPGQRVQAGDTLLIIEAMKMEFPLTAPCDGFIEALFCQAGSPVLAGDLLCAIHR